MRTTQKQLIQRVLVLAVGICILTAACGSDSKKTATPKPSAAANAAAESAYCDTAREWGVHELASHDDSDPAATKTWFGEYVAFNEKARGQAPAELRDEWDTNVEGITTVLMPVVEKYEFNIERLMTAGSDEEKALLDNPPEDIQKAQAAIHQYESNVCASEQPPAAEVDFSNEKPVAAYCEASAAEEELTSEVDITDPAAVRKLATSKEFLAIFDKQRDNAPAVIKADIGVMYTFIHDRHLPTLEKHGYDVTKLLLEGPQADREALNSTSPDVREHSARIDAYDEQVCGGE